MSLIPEGYTELRLGGIVAVLRHDLVPALRPTLERDGTLLGGGAGVRGEAPRVVIEGVPPLRVRRYHRGGLIGRFLGDLHLSPTRSVRELTALLRARRLGVPVPEPVAAISASVGAAFVWHELATIEVPDARPLPEALAACDARERREWIRRAACAVAKLHQAEFDHADLHAGNMLAAGSDVVLLDLDRCELGITVGRRIANLARLFRSIAKSPVLSRVVTRSDRIRFLRAYSETAAPLDLRRTSRACNRTVWWHSWTWGGKGEHRG